MTIFESTDDFQQYLSSYKYQPKLTEKLDSIGNKTIDQNLLNEIVLWKVNRYLECDNETFESLNSFQNLHNGEHRKACEIILKMLDFKGADIAMVSTILRFRNPYVFPIIDKRAYRALYGEKLPIYSGMKPKEKTNIYLDYIDKMIEFCNSHSVDFKVADRLLYQFDKEANGKL